MPPKPKIKKEDIVNAAADVIRENGASGLNARAVAKKLGCSTQPVFSNFSSMKELENAVTDLANRDFFMRITGSKDENKYPRYKVIGMEYIRFAIEEPEIYKFLFMRDRMGDNERKDAFSDVMPKVISTIQNALNISKADAERLHFEMWVFVHGIASMCVTSYLKLSDEQISGLLTDVYDGLRLKYCNKE